MNWNVFLIVLLFGLAVMAVVAGLFIVTWLCDRITEYMNVNYDTAYIISVVCGVVYVLILGATVAGVLT